MKMFFPSISSFSSWYLSAAFQSNVGCFCVGPPVLDITCTDLTVFTGPPASLTHIIAALAVPMAVYVIACIMFCSAAILFCIVYVRN